MDAVGGERDGRLRIRLLGPVEAELDGSTLDLGPRKQRTVFTILAMNLDRVVPADQLVDTLWGDDASPKRLSSLHAYISNLRRVLESSRRAGTRASRLLTAPPGYRLSDTDVWCDVVELEATSREAAACIESERWSDAERLLDACLALWRGPVLDELATEAFAVDEVARLDALRLTLQEWQFDARTRRNDATVAQELEHFVEVHPLRERAWSLLIRSLVGLGRRDAARETFRRVESRLGDELGIEPSPELRELARELGPVRDAGHASEDERPAPMTNPISVGPGRDAEVKLLSGALRDALGERPRIVVISGEAGIGKTFVVDAVVNHAQAMGLSTVLAYCQDDWSAPFAPWRQVLEQLDDQAVDWDGSADERLDIRAAQRRLADVVARSVLSRARGQPLVVVLEDLHWADESSLRCLELLDRSLTSEALLVLATCRDERSADVSRTMGSLSRSEHVVRVELEPLTADALAELAEQHAIRPLGRDELELLKSRSGGNPLFAIELARWLPRRTTDQAVPAGIVDVVRRRLGQLAPDVVDVLTTAAVIGATFDLDVLAGAADVDRDAMFDFVDIATVHRMVEPEPQRPNRYQFSHDVVRDAVVHEMPPLRRARLHHRIADVMERVTPDAADLAVHRWEARVVAPEPARAACRRAALLAEASFASVDATEWWERALSIEPSESLERGRLLLNLGRSLERQGSRGGRPDAIPPVRGHVSTRDTRSNHRSSWSYLQEAVDEALRHDDIDTAFEAAIAFGDDWDGLPWSGFRSRPSEAVRRVQMVLDHLPSDRRAHRARLLAKLAVGHYSDDDVTLSDELSQDGLDLARAVGDQSLVAATLLSRVLAIHRPGRDAEQLALLDELLSLRPVAPEHQAAGMLLRCNLHLRSARRGDAEDDLERARGLARDGGMEWAERQVMLLDAVLAVFDGETDIAEKLLVQVSRAIRRREANDEVLASRRARAAMATFLGLRWSQGRLAELEPMVHTTAELLPAAKLDMLGPVLVAQGRLDEARQLSDSDEATTQPPRDGFWLIDVTLRAILAAGTDNAELARRLYEWLAPYAGSVTVAVGMVTFGPLDQTLGDLANTFGDSATALHHYQVAMDVATRVRAPRWERAALESREAVTADRV
jgi:DNA-binding SARP family transcriptional activator/RecA/RadA recombinase